VSRRVRWAPKLPVARIVRLYEADAKLVRDDALVDDVGWRLHARCQDVLLVTDSKVACPDCGTTFAVPWIGEPADRISACPGCGWSITAEEYHATFEHRDLNGAGAREAFAEYVTRFPHLAAYGEKMLAIDRLVHAVHTTGGVAARNLFEGRARDVLATLDALAAGVSPGSG
jgi:ribosomal protein L37AE/L43A